MIRFATDCTGIDAPYHALANILPDGVAVQYEFASDIDPRVRAYLQSISNVPQITFEDIVLRTDNTPYCDLDLYVAGFPCQSFSTLGKRKGLDSPQGEVFYDVLRFIQDATPKIFVLENVARLLDHDRGKTFKVIMKHLKALPDYCVECRTISPLDIGFPHSRSRVFIVGIRSQIGDRVPWSLPHAQTVALETLLMSKQQAEQLQPSCVRPLSITAAKNLEWHRAQVDDFGDRLYIVDLACSQAFAIKPKPGRSPCLKRYNQMLYISTQARYITYREALRLQGFPDSTFAEVCIKAIAGDHLSLSQAKVHQLAGNSICIPVIRAVLQPLVQSLHQQHRQRNLDDGLATGGE